jgi:hypothetical protein
LVANISMILWSQAHGILILFVTVPPPFATITKTELNAWKITCIAWDYLQLILESYISTLREKYGRTYWLLCAHKALLETQIGTGSNKYVHAHICIKTRLLTLHPNRWNPTRQQKQSRRLALQWSPNDWPRLSGLSLPSGEILKTWYET